MAIQIINDPYRTFGGGLGQALGTGLGSGLSKGLSALAEAKLKQLENAPFARALAQTQGMAPEGEDINQILQGLNPQQAFQVAQLNLQRQKAEEAQRKATQEQEFREEKEKTRREEKLQPFMKENREIVKSNKEVKKLAREMLASIEKNKDKWPGQFKGNLPGVLQDIFLRDPDVREYRRKGDALVLALGHMRKGIPSKHKLLLEAAAKVNLNQPIETQIMALKSILGQTDEEDLIQKFIHTQKDKYGTLPSNIEQRITDFTLAQDNPIGYPEFYKEGTQIETDEGKICTRKNGAWVDENGEPC